MKLLFGSKTKNQNVIPVNTPAGIRAAQLATLFREMQVFCFAIVLVTVGHIFNWAIADMFLPANYDLSQLITPYYPLLAVGTIGAVFFAYLEIWHGGKSARAEEKRLRQNLLKQSFEVLHPENETLGEQVNLYTDSIERFTEYRQVYLGPTKAALAIPFLTLIYVIIAIDWVTGLVLILMCPVIPIAISGFMKLYAERAKRSRAQRAKLTAKYLEALQTLTTLRLFGAAAARERELKTEGEKNRLTIMRILAGNQIVIIIMDGLFGILLICLAVALSAWRVSTGAIQIADALQIILLSVILLEPLQQVAGFFYIGMGGKAAQRALARYQDKLNHSLKIAPEDSSEAAKKIPGIKTDNKVEHYLELEHVDFSYDGETPVLKDLNLKVKIGEKLVLVGPSGGGKSTLLYLLQGRLQPTAGIVKYQGVPVSTYRMLKEMALVSQRTWLFTGSIRENLLMARQTATEGELWEALDRAGIGEFVRSLPAGLESAVGEDGNYLSGGQAQRLSLARAFVSGRKLLIFDEPTSQLDRDTEASFINTLAAIDSSYTLIIVTHRYQVLKLADSAYRLDSGALQAVRPEELLSSATSEGDLEGTNE